MLRRRPDLFDNPRRKAGYEGSIPQAVHLESGSFIRTDLPARLDGTWYSQCDYRMAPVEATTAGCAVDEAPRIPGRRSAEYHAGFAGDAGTADRPGAMDRLAWFGRQLDLPFSCPAAGLGHVGNDLYAAQA